MKEMLMELDDLKQAVTELDRGIAEVRAVSVAVYKERRLDRTRAFAPCSGSMRGK